MIQISTDKTRLDINLIHGYLSKESYWAIGRDIEIVKQSIDNCLCFGLYIEDKQIGFARVVTDYAVSPGYWTFSSLMIIEIEDMVKC